MGDSAAPNSSDADAPTVDGPASEASVVEKKQPPPLPATQPVVESSSNFCPTSENATGIKQDGNSMEEVMKGFLKYEQSLTVPDYIKRFYQIRLEQEAMRGEDELSCINACNPIHFIRNRYRDILPYDYNRVSLQQSEENPDGYMNASHIKLDGGLTQFIAAQAPLPATLDEWWQLIDEQNVHVILMLCKLCEMGRVKCERYWPETVGTKEIFGNYEITLEEEHRFENDDEYLMRVLTMENQASCEKRTIKQLHYIEWPDHGCPSGEKQLLNMIEKTDEITSDKSLPVLVHCSAGVGRTGTIIAVNHIRELIKQKTLDHLDLFELVMTLRKQRASMVQTQDQYQFVHKCVASYCRKYLGLPEPVRPPIPPKPVLAPVRAYVADSTPMDGDCSDDDLEGTVVPDFPHEPPAPRGPEELGSAAS